ncbi:MAG: ApaG protein [Saprospiraceae bacterium]|jgi:ApaG protein
MMTAITKGIEVSVETQYESLDSNPRESKYIWSYHITVQNHSDKTVQLKRRHWFIHDSLLGRREVKGDGIIGLQPILVPGATHSYTSWCPFNSEIGMMRGYFEMIRAIDGKAFSVKVPDFTMCAPSKCN